MVPKMEDATWHRERRRLSCRSCRSPCLASCNMFKVRICFYESPRKSWLLNLAKFSASTRCQSLKCPLPIAIIVFWVCIHFLLLRESEVSWIGEAKFWTCSRTMMLAMTMTITLTTIMMTKSTMTMKRTPKGKNNEPIKKGTAHEPQTTFRAVPAGIRIGGTHTLQGRIRTEQPISMMFPSTSICEPHSLQHLVAADASATAGRPWDPAPRDLVLYLRYRSSINMCAWCGCKDTVKIIVVHQGTQQT